MMNAAYPATIRTAFARLMLYKFVDSHQFPEDWKIPLLIRTRGDTADDYYMRMSEQEEIFFVEKDVLIDHLFEFLEEPSLEAQIKADVDMVLHMLR